MRRRFLILGTSGAILFACAAMAAEATVESGRWFLTIERLQEIENQPRVETRIVCLKSAARVSDLVSDVPPSCTLTSDSDERVLRWEVTCPGEHAMQSMRGEARIGDGQLSGTITIEHRTADGEVQYDARFEGRRTDATCTPES